jgi:C-terminal processing protease CtpA/Prc
MKKMVVSGLLLATLVAVAYVMTPGAAAQQRDRTPAPFGGWNLALEGPGSSIGVTVRDQTGDASGVVIDSVRDGTPATRAGLQTGDVVVEFNGRPVADNTDLVAMVVGTKPGTTVPVTIVRDKQRRTMNITVDELDLEAEAGSRTSSNERAPDESTCGATGSMPPPRSSSGMKTPAT